MPLNAPPEFNKAMERYSSARTVAEKIAALEEALTYLPKHKGAENMRAFLLRRLAELRKELERRRKAGKGRTVGIKKEGFMAVLFGFPNVGKSYILKALTGANVEVTDYPFSTAEPKPGMMIAGGGKVQLVEVPSYFEGYGDSKLGRVGLNVIRSADAVIFVLDLRNDPQEQLRALMDALEREHIYVNRQPPPLKVERRYTGGIVINGENFLTAPKETYVRILQSFGYHNVVLTLLGRVTPQDLVLALDESAKFLQGVALGNRAEKAPREHVDAFLALPIPKVLFRGEETKEELFKALGLIRVYTKPPRGKRSKEPVVLRSGATVEELAEIIAPKKEVKFARVWGSTKFPGQTVGPNYVLSDGDVVELHFSS